MKIQEAFAILLDIGCDISFGRNHIYQSKTFEYEILRFDEDSNLIENKELRFLNMNEAIAEFRKLAKGKLDD